ncbi:MAG: hypothetical protein AAGA42_16850 [Actinomycetota bacterium]
MSPPRQREDLELAALFGVPTEPLLTAFHRFGDRAADVHESSEWSWKFAPDALLRNRIFWIGAAGQRHATANHVSWLADQVDLNPEDLDGGRDRWNTILAERTDRVTIGYAGADSAAGRPPALKFYLSLEPRSDDIYRQHLRGLHDRLPAAAPPGPCRLILVYSVYADGRISSRVYVLWPQSALAIEDVRQWMSPFVGSGALSVAAGHPSSGLGVKNDTTDMLAVSFLPTGFAHRGHPARFVSPILRPVLFAAGRDPELARRLDRLTWVAAPCTEFDQEFSYELTELNIYVRIDASRRERSGDTKPEAGVAIDRRW